jgi:DNA-binding transcriptional LysR family regulator
MEIRHLRCFAVLSEELHFSRAAKRLHIGQPPLSKTIMELEDELGVSLFTRNRRGTRMTHAGKIFQEDVYRILTQIDLAKARAKSAGQGYHELLLGISEGTAPHLSVLLARSRVEEPEIVVRLVAVPVAELLRGLQENIFDAGFARSGTAGDGIAVEPVWRDEIKVVMPKRHPLLAYQQVPLQELARYPLVTYHPHGHEGYSSQLAHVLRKLENEPVIADRATSLDVMMTLVAAGYGIGFATTEQLATCNFPGVISRPINGHAMLTTYFLRREGDVSKPLGRFIARIRVLSKELATGSNRIVL